MKMSYSITKRFCRKPENFILHPFVLEQQTDSTYGSSDGEEPVEADEHDVEDRRRAQHVVHHQPQLTQTSAQPPLPRQHVGNIHWDTEPTYRYRVGGTNICQHIIIPGIVYRLFKHTVIIYISKTAFF